MQEQSSSAQEPEKFFVYEKVRIHFNKICATFILTLIVAMCSNKGWLLLIYTPVQLIARKLTGIHNLMLNTPNTRETLI